MRKQLKEFRILCFLPDTLKYLTATDTINFNGQDLKTSYIAHIINEMITKYTFNGEYVFPIWSKIMQSLYGKFYKNYINYIVNTGFMREFEKHKMGNISKRYMMDLNFLANSKIKRYPFYDMFLRRKLDDKNAHYNFTDLNQSLILESVRIKLVSDLYRVDIDSKKALDYLIELKTKNIITDNSFLKNHISIMQLMESDIFYKFDGFGRFHSNFTILKKELRHQFITIDGENICEIDIKNSQPLFLGVLINEEYNYNPPKKLQDYIDLVECGLLYEDFLQNCGGRISTRDEVKVFIFKVLFGKNNEYFKENKVFKSIYPEVFEFVKNYKKKTGSYKNLSHALQKRESEFIYNKVVNEILFRYPEIHLFTVHDSISYPLIYKEQVDEIFNKYRNQLFIQKISESI
jgi:hypothetical protein